MTIAPWRNTSPLRRRRRRPVLTPVDLLSTAHRFACSATSLPGMDDPCERCWRTIAANEDFEAWVVAWPVGSTIELHDHGDSAGAVVVASGVLHETSIRPGKDHRLRAVTTPVGTGEHVLFGSGDIHDFVNIGPGPALSVHVYSPALHSMNYFDWSDGDGLVQVRSESYYEGLLVV
jgi:Cysteine dioxygenase type I